ncbi:uncharacterized protein LOC121385422 [Gigantopelta aegis]|uniref:uncharacterized protein LOC121385422 n=1 Tax=Gigantopelta aegis TaxID=1735272 RepID=UPI001B8884F7|nr:uncharacterized protein LOC121385422 [Gigantopelta aegis]
MLKLAIVVLIAVTVQANTRPPRPTHRHPVHEYFYFFHDFHSHHYVMVDRGSCYLVTLSSDEESKLYDPTYLHTMQSKMITNLQDSSKITAGDLHSLDRQEHHRCHRHVFMMTL